MKLQRPIGRFKVIKRSKILCIPWISNFLDIFLFETVVLVLRSPSRPKLPPYLLSQGLYRKIQRRKSSIFVKI